MLLLLKLVGGDDLKNPGFMSERGMNFENPYWEERLIILYHNLPDPQLSTVKRRQRAQVFTSSISHAILERQLLAARTSKLELETKLREKELLVERLERDRRWFANREKEEREEKDREREAHEDEKVIVTHLTLYSTSSMFINKSHTAKVRQWYTRSTYFSDFSARRTCRPPRCPFSTLAAQTKPSHLRKHKSPPSPIRIHYYKMNSLNSELQPKKDVPQSKNYNPSLTSWVLARKPSCKGFGRKKIRETVGCVDLSGYDPRYTSECLYSL